jgi:hypothetical protein
VNIDDDPDIAILEVLFYAIDRKTGNPTTGVLPELVGLTKDEEEKIKKLRVKRMLQIFSYTMNETRKVIDKYAKIKVLIFSAKSSEKNRVSIYETFAKSFGEYQKENIDGFTKFTITLAERLGEDVKSFLELYFKEDGEGGFSGVQTSGDFQAHAPEHMIKQPLVLNKVEYEDEENE